MPAALDVDREAVKAHAITYGVREAARAFGLREDTVCQWSKREGWLAEAGEATVVQPLPSSMRKQAVSNVSTASQAARNSLADIGSKSRLNLARAVRKGSIAAARRTGDEIIKTADKLKSLADTGDKIFGWSNQAATPTLRLELIAGAVGQLGQDELPAIDVEAEVTAPAPSTEGA